MNLYYIGNNDVLLQNNKIFKGSITVERRYNTKNNICFKDLYKHKKVNYNSLADLKKIDKFFLKAVKMILKHNKDAYFLRYNEHNLKNVNLKKYHILKTNDYEMYQYINNKFLIRNDLKNITNTLEYCYVLGFKLKKFLLKKWETSNCDFVVQEKYGFAGTNTFIFTKNNYNEQLKKLKRFTTYAVSVLQKNCISVNIHLFIDDNNIDYFKPSQQIIDTINYNMNYNGASFELEKKIEDKIKTDSKPIGEFLQNYGYRGVLGIDFIYKNEKLYLMEINARFQASSAKLNEMLAQEKQQTLFDRQIKLLEKKMI